MKLLLDFLSLPLSLPIDPIWDYIICLILGEIAYRIAFYFAGMNGYSSFERYLLHWLVRIPFYFFLWAVACCIILIIRFLKKNWIWVIPIIMVVVLLRIGMVLWCKKRKERAEKDS